MAPSKAKGSRCAAVSAAIGLAAMGLAAMGLAWWQSWTEALASVRVESIAPAFRVLAVSGGWPVSFRSIWGPWSPVV